MPRKSYKLPSGEETRSAAKYVKAWTDLLDPIKKALGVEIVGFDPDVLIRNIVGEVDPLRKPLGVPATLPLWFVKRLSHLIKSRDAETAIPTEFSAVEAYEWGESAPRRVVPPQLQKKLFETAIARMQIYGWAPYLPGMKALLREYRCSKPRPGSKAKPTTYHIIFRPRRVLLNGFSIKGVQLHNGEPIGGNLSTCIDPVT